MQIIIRSKFMKKAYSIIFSVGTQTISGVSPVETQPFQASSSAMKSTLCLGEPKKAKEPFSLYVYFDPRN